MYVLYRNFIQKFKLCTNSNTNNKKKLNLFQEDACRKGWNLDY